MRSTGGGPMRLLAYNLFLHTLVAPALILSYGPRVLLGNKYRRSLAGKLGRLPHGFVPEALVRPRIWFHAVSVGEVVALGPLVKPLKALLPSCSVVVSTGTETGQQKAADSIPEADGLIYLPLDFPSFVNPVVRRIAPDLFVLMETELWPNLIHSLKQSSAAIALANGRISDRSFPRYRRLKRFFGPTLDEIDLFLMASEIDGQRIAEMGASSDRIHVTGNTKFDAALGRVPVEAEARLRSLFEIDPGMPVLVAGSTHPGEHEVILDSFRVLATEFPHLMLIIVPRHVEKTPLVEASMKERGMEPPLRMAAAEAGERRGARHVIIVDKTGELFGVYSLASVVFVGGSLVPLGGQNILEPAAWAKVVCFGPSMEDFRDAKDILMRAGAGVEVRSAVDLSDLVAGLLTDPARADRLGRGGREAVLKHVGSARTDAEFLVRALGGRMSR